LIVVVFAPAIAVAAGVFVSTAVADIRYPRAWKKHVLGFLAGIKHKKLLI
jgi:hypothetical protein